MYKVKFRRLCIATRITLQLTKSIEIKMGIFDFIFKEKEKELKEECFVISLEKGSDVIEPTNAQIEGAIVDVINKTEGFVILEKGERFIQYGGCTVGYKKDKDSLYETIRFDLSRKELVEMFMFFHNDPSAWNDTYEWELGHY